MSEKVERKISIGQLAKHWGCSRANVSKNVAKGMPMDSFEAADAWRIANSTRGVGFRSKGKSEAVPQPEAADSFLHKNEESEEPVEKSKPSAGRKKTKQLKTLHESLMASSEVESEALRLVQEAQRARKDDSLPLRIAAYNKAKEGRMQSEKLVRAYELETKTLITWDQATEMASRFLIPTLTRLRSLSKRAGPLANAADPEWAEQVIAREVENAIAEVQKLYAQSTEAGI